MSTAAPLTETGREQFQLQVFPANANALFLAFATAFEKGQAGVVRARIANMVKTTSRLSELRKGSYTTRILLDSEPGLGVESELLGELYRCEVTIINSNDLSR